MRALFSFYAPFVLVVPEKPAIPAFPTIQPIISEMQYQKSKNFKLTSKRYAKIKS